jgi:hypothetical protein
MLRDGAGKRFNKGKIRYDLVPAFAQEQYAKVLTQGAAKYGEDNWKRGMKWTTVLASLERHLMAIKRGEDYDAETKLLHSAHIMCNAAFLTEFYKIYPQGDDRDLNYLNAPGVAIIIDNAALKYFNSSSKPTFTPTCYILKTNAPTGDIEKWIYDIGFPAAPICSIPAAPICSIPEALDTDCKKNIIVSCSYSDFLYFNRNKKIFCYLYTTPENEHFEIGHRRIYSFENNFLCALIDANRSEHLQNE